MEYASGGAFCVGSVRFRLAIVASVVRAFGMGSVWTAKAREGVLGERLCIDEYY